MAPYRTTVSYRTLNSPVWLTHPNSVVRNAQWHFRVQQTIGHNDLNRNGDLQKILLRNVIRIGRGCESGLPIGPTHTHVYEHLPDRKYCDTEEILGPPKPMEITSRTPFAYCIHNDPSLSRQQPSSHHMKPTPTLASLSYRIFLLRSIYRLYKSSCFTAVQR